MREEEAMAVLCAAPGVSYGRREMALRAAESALEVLADPMAFAPQLGENGVASLRRMMRSGAADRLLDTIAAERLQLLLRDSPGYPPLLRHIAHPPHLLFVCGRTALDDPFPFAVVGTRGASDYGRTQTRRLAGELAGAGMCIVSGMALGIDACAHRGALDAGGRTVAVLGGALDKPYPTENVPLMREIIESGGSVVSEYPPGVAPTKYSFLHRNRIIAGMALGVLVTEGPRRSGALRTAQDALECGREVFALPGRVDSPGSQLPHLLLSEGARLATCAQDILGALSIEPSGTLPRDLSRELPRELTKEAPRQEKSRAMPRGLGETEAAVWRLLEQGERDFDELCEAVGLPSDELGAILMMMDMDGVIRALPGLRYALP